MNSQKEKLKREVFKKVTTGVASLGFSKGSRQFWFIEKEHFFYFFHLHSYSFNYSFRIHLGIRIKNDCFEAISLNGPSSNQVISKYFKLFNNKRTFEYSSNEIDLSKCSKNIIEYISRTGLPWFNHWTIDRLVSEEGKKIQSNESIEMLKRAIEGEKIGKNLDQTYRLLGIKKGT